jgi:phage baseplate assembly protein V
MKDIAGVVVGVVTQIDAATPAILVNYPWMSPPQSSTWAPISALMAGPNRGTYYMPEIGDEVLIAFEHGKFDHPFVVGFLWNGQDTPPANNPKLRLIRSLNGHEIALYDPAPSGGDQGYVKISDAHGNVIKLANGALTITGVGNLQINAPNVSINGRLVSPIGPPI